MSVTPTFRDWTIFKDINTNFIFKIVFNSCCCHVPKMRNFFSHVQTRFSSLLAFGSLYLFLINFQTIPLHVIAVQEYCLNGCNTTTHLNQQSWPEYTLLNNKRVGYGEDGVLRTIVSE